MIEINGFTVHYESPKGMGVIEPIKDLFDEKFSNHAPDCPIYVQCDDCKELMEYHAGSGEQGPDGKYYCPTCKQIVNELDVMNHMLEDNNRLIKELGLED